MGLRNGPNYVLMVYSRNRKQKGEIGPLKSGGGIGRENNIVTRKENWANSEDPVASKENGSPILKVGMGLKRWPRGTEITEKRMLVIQCNRFRILFQVRP